MDRAEEVIDLLVREGGKTRLEALGMEVVRRRRPRALLHQARAAACSRRSRSRCT